jgi:HNH endonuclease/AP2 domain
MARFSGRKGRTLLPCHEIPNKALTEGVNMTQDELKAILEYNQDNGTFTWIKSPRKGFVGKQAGYLRPDGYTTIKINQKHWMVHHLAWLYVYGTLPKMIDHINENKSDNKIENLRVCNTALNMQNKRKAQANNKTGYLGVNYAKNVNKYNAQICLNGKSKSLGYFNTAEEAHQAYLQAKQILHIFSPKDNYHATVQRTTT